MSWEFYYNALNTPYLILIIMVVGFVLLVKGADWLVDGASAIAKRLGVSDLIIGLTVVAFGTSMPEFVVNMLSSANGSSELAITNVLGSNSINIFVILGLTALVWPVTSERQSRVVDIPVAILGAALVFIFTCVQTPTEWTLHNLFHCFNMQTEDHYITATGGLILVVGFVLYLTYLFRQMRTAQASTQTKSSSSEEQMHLGMSILFVLLGLGGLTAGGQMCVDSATSTARMLGVSDAVIGLTVVALGTSLPELATSVMAALRKNSDLALGNCVGSCIFNVFFVLSISSCVHPLRGYEGLWLDALMAFAGPALTWLFVINDKKHQISRMEGAVLLAVYAIYLTWRLINC